MRFTNSQHSKTHQICRVKGEDRWIDIFMTSRIHPARRTAPLLAMWHTKLEHACYGAIFLHAEGKKGPDFSSFPETQSHWHHSDWEALWTTSLKLLITAIILVILDVVIITLQHCKCLERHQWWDSFMFLGINFADNQKDAHKYYEYSISETNIVIIHPRSSEETVV